VARNLIGKPNFYGLATVGERGQIVIPNEARNKLTIKAGDKLVIFGHGRMLHLMKAQAMDTFFDKIAKNITDDIAKMRKKIREENNKEK